MSPTAGSAHDHLHRLSELLPLVAGVRTSQDLDAVLPSVAEAASEASGAACVVILLRSLESGRIEPVAFHGPAELRDALVAARPDVEVPDLGLGTSLRSGCHVVALPGEPESAWVALTDKDDTPLGFLGACSGPGEGSPDDADLRILAAVAAYGAQALRRARASILATRHGRALEALLKLSAESDVADGVDALLGTVLEAAHGALGYRTVAIALVDPKREQLVQHSSIGPWPLPAAMGRAQVVEFFEGDRHLGVLVAADPRDADWSDSESLAILRLFAAQAASRIVASEAHAAARRLADTDALTGLGNRATFVRSAEELLRTRDHGEIAVLLCDMDGLKELNDSEGHTAGDARLQLTADVLAGACAASESAYRLGGDEFAVVVAAGGADRAACLTAEIETALDAAGAAASIGWWAGDPRIRRSLTVDELLERADAAMYRIKRGRRASRGRRAVRRDPYVARSRAVAASSTASPSGSDSGSPVTTTP